MTFVFLVEPTVLFCSFSGFASTENTTFKGTVLREFQVFFFYCKCVFKDDENIWFDNIAHEKHKKPLFNFFAKLRSKRFAAGRRGWRGGEGGVGSNIQYHYLVTTSGQIGAHRLEERLDGIKPVGGQNFFLERKAGGGGGGKWGGLQRRGGGGGGKGNKKGAHTDPCIKI
jgi:hypothetical protein